MQPTHDVEITIDGGANRVRGVAGGATVIWVRDDSSDDCWIVAAEVLVMIPGEARAAVAEAWGCNAALQLLMGTGSQSGCAQIVGDNFAVVRFLLSQGTLRQPHLEAVLDITGNRVSMGHWRLACEAVRQRWNHAADRVATFAKGKALDAPESRRMAIGGR